MLHQSMAVVGPGELMPSFPLRLRNTGPKPSADYNYRGTVACLHAAPEEVEESAYELSMSLAFAGGEECYASFFQDPFNAKMTPAELGVRMDAFNAKAKAAYPYLSRIPTVKYEKETDVLGRFVVALPPFTSVYTSAPGFWDALGFGDDTYARFPGSKMKNSPAATVLALGFANPEARVFEVVSRQMSNGVEPLHLIYAQVAGANATKQLHLEYRFLQDSLPLGLARKKPMNRTQVADGLATVLNDGLRLLNLDPTAISVESAGRYLMLKSKEYNKVGGAEAQVTVVLTFSDELKDYLQMAEDKLNFPLSDARSYEVQPRDEVDFDPLDQHYPVTLLLQQGQAKNYVEGKGFASLLAVMRSKEDFVGDGAVFSGGCDQLTVRFLDKRLQPIRLRDRLTTFVLTLELTLE